MSASTPCQETESSKSHHFLSGGGTGLMEETAEDSMGGECVKKGWITVLIRKRTFLLAQWKWLHLMYAHNPPTCPEDLSEPMHIVLWCFWWQLINLHERECWLQGFYLTALKFIFIGNWLTFPLQHAGYECLSYFVNAVTKIDTSMSKAVHFLKLQFRVPFKYQAHSDLFKGLLCSQLQVQLILELCLWPPLSVPTWIPLHILHSLFPEGFGIQTTAAFFFLLNNTNRVSGKGIWQRNESPLSCSLNHTSYGRSYCILNMLTWFH